MGGVSHQSSRKCLKAWDSTEGETINERGRQVQEPWDLAGWIWLEKLCTIFLYLLSSKFLLKIAPGQEP